VTRIGELVVPGGAEGLTARKFAECFLDCAAKYPALEENYQYSFLDGHRRLLQHIYCQFYQCSMLRPLFVDHEVESFWHWMTETSFSAGLMNVVVEVSSIKLKWGKTTYMQYDSYYLFRPLTSHLGKGKVKGTESRR